MLSREEKARAMLSLEPRGGGVLLQDFKPNGFGLSLLHKLTAMGIPEPVLHGGSLRDAYMKAVYGDDVAPDDYDIRSGLNNIPAYRDGGPERLLRLFLENGFSLNPDIDSRKKNPEILQGTDSSGAVHTLVTFRMIYEGKKVDYIAATNFSFGPRDMASTANDSFSSIAMGPDGAVYADRNFEADAECGVTRLYNATAEQTRYISEEHLPKLNRRYGFEIRLCRD